MGFGEANDVPHNKKGLVVPPACVAAPVCGSPPLMSGWGMDMEAGIPMFGIWPTGPRGAMPAMGTIETGPAGGIEDRGKGSLLLWAMLKPCPLRPIMGLTLIWLRVGGCGWFTWKGLT